MIDDRRGGLKRAETRDPLAAALVGASGGSIEFDADYSGPIYRCTPPAGADWFHSQNVNEWSEAEIARGQIQELKDTLPEWDRYVQLESKRARTRHSDRQPR